MIESFLAFMAESRIVNAGLNLVGLAGIIFLIYRTVRVTFNFLIAATKSGLKRAAMRMVKVHYRQGSKLSTDPVLFLTGLVSNILMLFIATLGLVLTIILSVSAKIPGEWGIYKIDNFYAEGFFKTMTFVSFFYVVTQFTKVALFIQGGATARIRYINRIVDDNRRREGLPVIPRGKPHR